MVEQRKLLEKHLGSEEFRNVLRVCEGSRANFVMLEVGKRSTKFHIFAHFFFKKVLPGSPLSADKLTAALLNVGIVIRYFGGSNKGCLHEIVLLGIDVLFAALANFIRISSGLPSDTLRVISACASLLLHSAIVPPVRPSAQTKKVVQYRVCCLVLVDEENVRPFGVLCRAIFAAFCSTWTA